jgi:thymidylate synthase
MIFTVNNANSAYEVFLNYLTGQSKIVKEKDGTIYARNVGVIIENPLDNLITNAERKWSKSYADAEWQWYLSGSPYADEIAKRAPLWKKMMDEDGRVNSNYGYQWDRGNQLDYVIEELEENPNSRRASITIYDGKEHEKYSKDTPCTQYINFYIDSRFRLCMNVHMRSNDVVYGFCNDQYCFSKLQELVAEKLNYPVGEYFHFVNDLHIYQQHYNLLLNKKNEKN